MCLYNIYYTIRSWTCCEKKQQDVAILQLDEETIIVYYNDFQTGNDYFRNTK